MDAQAGVEPEFRGVQPPKRGRSVAIVGGGFGGVAAAVMLRRRGYEDVTLFERGERVGGVWNSNTYPGAACDIASHLYEFSFAPNPSWSRRFAPQAEIQAYLEDITVRFGVADRIRTGVEVESAAWDQARSRWVLQTSAGPHEADVLITACGQLTTPKVPPIPGVEDFEGPSFHTGGWRHDVDLSGKRVAVVGTGASAIQMVPAIQPTVSRLDVYQRSPGWTMPKMDHAYAPWMQKLFELVPAIQRADRWLQQATMDLGALAMTRHRWMLAPLRLVGRKQIEKAIADPELRAKLIPTDEVGCKRLMLTDTWYPALAESNVHLIDEAVTEVTASGIRDADGSHRDVDVIVWATGFRSHDFVAPMEITGREGRSLAEDWAEGARAYLGVTVPGYPNLFLLYGPNTNGGTGSVVETIECAMGQVVAALEAMDAAKSDSIEVTQAAADHFDVELRRALQGTVWHSGCRNWYVDENGHDASQWPWTWRRYGKRTATLAPGAYRLGAIPAQPRFESRTGSAG